MASEVQICNLALVHIGANRVTSLSDQSVEARECNAIYSQLRDEVLSAFPWTFARSRVALAQDTATPSFGYAYSYLLPSDCLRPISIAEGDTADVSYVIEGRSLLTDSATVSLRYIKRETDPALYPPSFVACLSQRMAVDLAMSVAKSTSMALKMGQLYEGLSKQHHLTDARKDTLDSFSDTSYTDSRGSMKIYAAMIALILTLLVLVGISYAGTSFPITADTSPNGFNVNLTRAKMNAAFTELSGVGRRAIKAGHTAKFGNVTGAGLDLTGRARFRNHTTSFYDPANVVVQFTPYSSATRGWYLRGKRK